MINFKKALVGFFIAIAIALALTSVVAASGVASATVYSGTIDCGGLDVEGMWINQTGNSGWASWSYTSPGRANWDYDFNGNKYSVVVGCGGSPATWLTTNLSTASVYPSASQDWVCNTFDHTCVLG